VGCRTHSNRTRSLPRGRPRITRTTAKIDKVKDSALILLKVSLAD